MLAICGARARNALLSGSMPEAIGGRSDLCRSCQDARIMKERRRGRKEKSQLCRVSGARDHEGGGMITAFVCENGALLAQPATGDLTLPKNAVWIDLLNPEP